MARETQKKSDMRTCLDIIRSFPKRYSYPLTLVYQVGRVGSTATTHAVKTYYPGVVLHLHALKNNDQPKLSHRLIRLWKMFYPVHIIAPIRKPLPWSLSFFFQQEKSRIDKDYRHITHKRDKRHYINNLRTSFLQDHLASFIRHYDTWFDRNIRRHFHIDALRTPFSSSGYQTYHHKRHKLLVFRSELPDTEKEAILASFLDIPLCVITSRNMAKKGVLAKCYKALKRTTRLSRKQNRLINKATITKQFYAKTHTKRDTKQRQRPPKQPFSLRKIRTHITDIQSIIRYRIKIHKTHNPHLAIIYQMGKVGSSAVLDAMVRSYKGAVFHTHNLSMPPAQARRLHAYVRQWIESHPTYTISLVRHPLEHAISWFFDNLTTYYPQGHAMLQQHPHTMSGVNDIALDPWLQAFHTHYDAILHRAEQWYQNNIEKHLHIDVYAQEFPHDKGYAFYEQGHHKLLLMRSECPDTQKSELLRSFIPRSFIPMDDICVLRSNVTTLRPSATLYRRLKTHIVLDNEQLETLRSLRVFRHFYDQATIDNTCTSYRMPHMTHEEDIQARPGRLELPAS